MTVFLGFEGRSAPAIRCDRCGKMVPIPLGPFHDRCSGEAYMEYLAMRDVSEKGWLDQPVRTDEQVVNEFNEELWSRRGPHPAFEKALKQIGFEANGMYMRTVCAECREAEKEHWNDRLNLDNLLIRNGVPIVWPWPEDDVPEPMPYQIFETEESYMRRREKRKALREQGRDPDRTPRYVLVASSSYNTSNEPLSDDWEESVKMAEDSRAAQLDYNLSIADTEKMVRIPRREWR